MYVSVVFKGVDIFDADMKISQIFISTKILKICFRARRTEEMLDEMEAERFVVFLIDFLYFRFLTMR